MSIPAVSARVRPLEPARSRSPKSSASAPGGDIHAAALRAHVAIPPRRRCHPRASPESSYFCSRARALLRPSKLGAAHSIKRRTCCGRAIASSAATRGAELIAEHVDRAQPQAVQEIPDGAGEVRDRAAAARSVRQAVTRQVRRIDTAILAELAQHRREHAPGAAAVMQADGRHALVEAAARRISGNR